MVELYSHLAHWTVVPRLRGLGRLISVVKRFSHIACIAVLPGLKRLIRIAYFLKSSSTFNSRRSGWIG